MGRFWKVFWKACFQKVPILTLLKREKYPSHIYLLFLLSLVNVNTCVIHRIIGNHLERWNYIMFIIIDHYLKDQCIQTAIFYIILDHCSRVPQWSKTLHLSARGVTAVPGLNPGCITSGRDWESHREAHNWPRVIGGLDGVGRHCK